jgi:hypothetical protein
MTTRHLVPLALTVALSLALAACAQKPAPALVAAVPAPEIIAPPAQLTAPAPLPAIEPAAIAAAQRNFRALGYNVGKSGNLADPAFQRAILTFEKDQGLTEDGILSAAVMDRLKLMRAALLKSADTNRSASFIYSDGAARRTPLAIAAAPPGFVSNAPANFMLPLRPGAQGSYQLGSRAADGSFKAAMTMTCQAGRNAQAALPLGVLDATPVDCHGDGPNAPQTRALYSASLGAVVRQESANASRDLVAIRPATNDWPSAARTGLDWALTHALETTGAPVSWSSTAVAPHFEIRASAKLNGQDAGLSGKYAGEVCRRFDMVQAGTPALHYPGIACQTVPGTWSLPGGAAFAAPASGLAARSVALRGLN